MILGFQSKLLYLCLFDSEVCLIIFLNLEIFHHHHQPVFDDAGVIDYISSLRNSTAVFFFFPFCAQRQL